LPDDLMLMLASLHTRLTEITYCTLLSFQEKVE
jgi:hypothetical protein